MTQPIDYIFNTAPSIGSTGGFISSSSDGTAQNIILFGHSFENFCGPYITGNFTDYNQNSWFAYGNAELNWTFNLYRNAGTGGNTIALMAARFNTDIVPYLTRAKRVCMGGGTNDDLTTPTKVNTSWALFKTMADSILSSGCALTIRTDTVKNADSTAQIVGQNALNNYKRQYAEVNNCVLFDLAAAVTNPVTGLICAAGAYGALVNMYAVDGVHLSFYGASIAGKEFYRVHSHLPGASSYTRIGAGGTTNLDVIYDSTNGVWPTNNLIANGKMIGSAVAATAPGTGNIATGYTNVASTVPATGGTAAFSKVARTDGRSRGEWQQISIGPGATTEVGTTQINRESVVSTTIDGTRGINVGDTIFGALEFQTDSTNWCGTDGLSPTTLELRLACQDSGFTVLSAARCFPSTSPNGYPSRIAQGVLRTPNITIPASTAHIYVYVYFNGVGTVRFSELGAHRYSL